jgi:hypothetical protein
LQPMQRNESSDHSDQRDRATTATLPGSAQLATTMSSGVVAVAGRPSQSP